MKWNLCYYKKPLNLRRRKGLSLAMPVLRHQWQCWNWSDPQGKTSRGDLFYWNVRCKINERYTQGITSHTIDKMMMFMKKNSILIDLPNFCRMLPSVWCEKVTHSGQVGQGIFQVPWLSISLDHLSIGLCIGPNSLGTHLAMPLCCFLTQSTIGICLATCGERKPKLGHWKKAGGEGACNTALKRKRIQNGAEFVFLLHTKWIQMEEWQLVPRPPPQTPGRISFGIIEHTWLTSSPRVKAPLVRYCMSWCVVCWVLAETRPQLHHLQLHGNAKSVDSVCLQRDTPKRRSASCTLPNSAASFKAFRSAFRLANRSPWILTDFLEAQKRGSECGICSSKNCSNNNNNNNNNN